MPRRTRNTGKRPPFRLMREARTLGGRLKKILETKVSERRAYELFKEIRWSDNDGEPYCPHCGSTRVYALKRPGWWRCAEWKDCNETFSVTSGTIFHSRKLPFSKIVKLAAELVEGVGGKPALQMHFAIDAQYKTTWVNTQKLREAMASDRERIVLGGNIEIDGSYYGGHVRQKNIVKERRDRRKEMAEKGKQRVLMVVRERGGKTVSFAADQEDQIVAFNAVRALIQPDDKPHIYCDGHKAYDVLNGLGYVHVVDHNVGYSLPDDHPKAPIARKSTNLAENAFFRSRRMERGAYLHIGPTYLDFYAGELGWRENTRRFDDETALRHLLGLALRHPVSRVLKGYWQHHLLPDDQLERKEIRWARVFGVGERQETD